MSDDPPEQELPPSEAADEVTVGAWLDLDPPPADDPPSLVPEPQPQKPGLWERCRRWLTGGG